MILKSGIQGDFLKQFLFRIFISNSSLDIMYQCPTFNIIIGIHSGVIIILSWMPYQFISKYRSIVFTSKIHIVDSYMFFFSNTLQFVYKGFILKKKLI